MRKVGFPLLVLALAACGAEHDVSEPTAATDPASELDRPGSSTSAMPDGPSTKLFGVWKVEGKDAIGAYEGQVEIADKEGRIAFTRVVRFPNVIVEGDRELWWVWTGKASPTPKGDVLEVAIELTKADFVKKRGELVRTEKDKAKVSVTGSFTLDGAQWKGTFSGEGISATEIWTDGTPSGGPIFAGKERKLVFAHDPPSAIEKQGLFTTFKSYQDLPRVKAYATRPEFQAAVHGFFTDFTDYAFYQTHPKALRIVDKVKDDISLLETLSRANAFRYTFAGKQACFDSEAATFVDPTTGMLGELRSDGSIDAHNDGALWTGTYVAVQAYKAENGDLVAKDRLRKSLDGILVLQEITGDKTHFARTLQVAKGPPPAKWRAGTGPFAHLQWKEGGNNDMIKGLFYAMTMGWKTLCKGGAATPGDAALCARIVKNAKELADHSPIVRESNGNTLLASWLAAVVTGESGYRFDAELAWQKLAVIVEKGGGPYYENGISDWSGNNLNFTDFTIQELLAEELDLNPLGGGTAAARAKGAAFLYDAFARVRIAQFDLLYAALAKGSKTAVAMEDARSRLREIPCPKTSMMIDHTMRDDFVMSPYPSLPWKQDWTTSDRYQALFGAPIYEAEMGMYVFKDNPHYVDGNTIGRRHSGVDYLHAYWYARRHGLLLPNE